MNGTLPRLAAKAEIMFCGRLFNLRPQQSRRAFRDRVVERVAARYLRRFLPPPGAVTDTPPVTANPSERIFSLWLQGEENAPPLAKACFASVRRHCAEELVVLDEGSLYDRIELPDFIVDKRRRGLIGPAHFADIVRVELLHTYGGVWFDATCFVTSPIPERIAAQDFFVFLAGDIYPHSFIQNCFIRSRRGAYLLEAWRWMIHKYWESETEVFNYFVHQMLFRALVKNDPRAIEHFAAMPHIDQKPTHAMWWEWGPKPFDAEVLRRISDEAFFQKTAYRTPWAEQPPKGSFADRIIDPL